jgi:Raf kinase inhibitor-like YbhB/YbcL family protein
MLLQVQKTVQMRNIVTRATALCVVLIAQCHAVAADVRNQNAPRLEITSPVFANNEAIPSMYTCEGRNASPPLAWSGVPPNAKSLVLIVDDPDAPNPAAPNRTWVHWVVYDIPPATSGIKEATKSLPQGAREGLNDSGQIGYSGPCPPIGRHRYFLKLYAVDTVLSDLKRPVKGQVEAAMKGHVIARAELVGTYQKKK